MAYTHASYPAVLTKANWDKKKGTFAKMAGKTGVGEALDKLKKAWDAVDWAKVEIASNRPSQSEYSLKKVAELQAAALSEAKGSIAKVRELAYEARDLAKKTAAKFKANKLIPSSAGALCIEIAGAADFLGVGCNLNTLGTVIKDEVAEVRKMYDATAESAKKNIPVRAAALSKAIKAVSEPPTYESWAKQGVMTKCRDLNQLIGNIPKLSKMGYDLGMDQGKAKTFFDDMREYAANEVPFKKGDADAAKKAKTAVLALVKRAEVF